MPLLNKFHKLAIIFIINNNDNQYKYYLYYPLFEISNLTKVLFYCSPLDKIYMHFVFKKLYLKFKARILCF